MSGGFYKFTVVFMYPSFDPAEAPEGLYTAWVEVPASVPRLEVTQRAVELGVAGAVNANKGMVAEDFKVLLVYPGYLTNRVP